MPPPKDPVKYEEWRKNLSEAQTKRWENPEERKRYSEAQTEANKKRYEDPANRKKQSEARKKYFEDPENRKKQSAAIKKSFENPDARMQRSKSKKKYYDENSDAKEKLAQMSKKYWESPEARQQRKDKLSSPDMKKKQSDKMKEYYNNTEARINQSITRKKHYVDHPEAREQLSAIRVKLYIDAQWYGSVKYKDNPYCEKFDSWFKERARAYFDYRCFECGVLQGKKKLSVHHVHYDKKMCCNGSPRDVVPLCPSCHSKTNHNRDYWEDHFTEMLYKNDLDGKCFFTKEEMKKYITDKHDVFN